MLTIRFSHQRRGSSLVMVLLTIAAASIVILTGANALINTARQRGSSDARIIANQMADSALQDAAFRYANRTSVPSSLTALEQYGAVPISGGLLPVTHGFKQGTDCKELASDSELATQFDASCPKYELAIRTVVSPETPATGYVFSTRDLPLNQPIRLWLPSFTGSVTLAVETATCVGCRFTVEELNPAGNPIGAAQTLQTSLNITNNAVRSIRITATDYNVLANGGSTRHKGVVRATSSTGAFTIGKGFSTFEATGIAQDGTTVRKLVNVRLFDTQSIGSPPTVTKNLTTTTQQFTAAGNCRPSPDACR